MAKEKKELTEEKTVVKREKKSETPSKLTYEQLEQLAGQYYNQNKAFAQRIDELTATCKELTDQLEMYQKNEYWARIDLLWRILTLEGNEEIFSESFVRTVSKEFAERVYPPKTEKKEE